jgi:hypothetical protein
MREIYKTYSQKGKKRVNITTISVALLVAATFILGAASPVMSIQTHTMKLNVNEESEEVHSTGLAPLNKDTPTYPSDAKTIAKAPVGPIDCEYMYGYKAYPAPEKTIKFTIEDPGTFEDVGETITGDFLAGGTYSCDGQWLGTEYGSGVLYTIDPYTGDMESIGGGGTGLNALAYNHLTNRMYGICSNDNVWEVNPDTGEQEMLFSLSFSGGLTIGAAFDIDGMLYSWDLIQDSLWKIDVDAETIELVGSLGLSLNYAQDGDFCRDTDVLYLTAYVGGGQLYSVDKNTAEATLIGNLEGNAEIDASIFLNSCVPPEHDIRLVSIDSPATGRAFPDMPMTITVKNVGNNTETFDAQMEIIKCEAGPLIYEEYFDDCVMPDGWETDYWTVVNSNNAGGEPCEARVYKYDYPQGQYYDNYIQSPQTDCTGLEKVNLRFRWAGDYYYPQYCNVYIKFRRNSTSPWKDVTPWENPVGENQDGELYEIGCYGFGEPMGDEFQMKWEYLGYYYYYNYLYLDDITLEACGGCAEYAELEEDITLEKEEEIQIQFPTWTPSEWQNETSENSWEEYPIHAFVMLEGDENPRNDDKWILIDLWYPWMHDIEVMSIDSPHEGRSLPGQTFPVQATMRNVGQYAECCIPIDLTIGEPYLLGTLFEEYDWPGSTYYPGSGSGWTDEHDFIAYYYGWYRRYGNTAGGTPYEAYLPYYRCRQDYVFYSMAIDTSAYSLCRLQFKTYVDHWLGSGYYSVEAGYSFDAETWYAAWSVEPSSNFQEEVDVPIEGGHATTYIGFWLKGNPTYLDYWYLDDVKVIALGVDEEYNDFACQGPDIEPNEEATFVMEDWTPAFLAEETTGTKTYLVECFIEMEGDKNPANDIKTEQLVLDFWHDSSIDVVESPVGGCPDRMGELVLYDNGEPDGLNGLAGGMYNGYSNMIADDFEAGEDWAIQGGKLHFLWNSGSTSNLETLRVYVFEEVDECEPSLVEYEIGEASEWTEETTGTYYYGRPEIVVDFLLEDEIKISPGRWWIAMQPDGLSEDIAYILTAPQNDCEIMIDLPYWGVPRWTKGSAQWGSYYDIAWEVHGSTGGPPSPSAWIQAGTEDIDVIVGNHGTFDSMDLTCYAQIYEYITDPENGTELYNESIANIDLDTPLGGTEDLSFPDFTFAEEGRYGLFLQLPADPDDVPKNNEKSWGVWVDETEPMSDYPAVLDPPEPTGDAGWYVDDVTVTLNASDPWSNAVTSGVKEIRYQIDSGPVEVIDGSTGSFVLTEDGEDILIEYWAVDCVGNEESPKNSFTVSIDQTVPDISLTYEVIGGNMYQGWDFEFTANAVDEMSGMIKVDFYFNNELQHTVEGAGPDYVWEFRYWPIPKAIIRATGTDEAGLTASDEIVDPVKNAHSTPQPQQSQEQPKTQPLPR